MTTNVSNTTSLNVSQLLRICIESFVEDDINGNAFQAAFLRAHEWILDSVELMTHFISIYQKPSVDTNHKHRVCQVVAFWLETCPTHFDSPLRKLVDCLRNLALADGIIEAEILLNTNQLPSHPWLRNISLRNPVGRQVSLSFELCSTTDISTSLSHIDYKTLYRIPIGELKKYCKDGNLSSTPLLKRSITVFNSLSNWIQYMILSKPTPADRAKVMSKFINVGMQLKILRNYNTLMAVIGSVTHSSIARLSKTIAFLSSDDKKNLATLTQLVSTQSNFAKYRAALNSTSNRFCIPIMGVHLKDLIAFYSKEKERDRYRLYSYNSILKLAKLLSFFLGFNRMTHNFPEASIDLINTLKVSLDIAYNEDEIYQLSLKIEPRSLLRFQGRTKSVVFADWASGVTTTFDPQNNYKHVSAMVEAVFKHYDDDKDGYISQSEFRQITGNFPSIASFRAIDTDRDGQISKLEMKAYFIHVSKQSMASSREYEHNFHESTFITPISCAFCGKLVWGIIRGYKCKDCEAVVHIYCKDRANVECSRQAKATNSSSTPVPISTKQPKRLFFSNVKKEKRSCTVSSTFDFDASSQEGGECSISFCKPFGRPRSQSNKDGCIYCKNDQKRNGSDHLSASLVCEEIFEDISPCLSVNDSNSINAPVL